MVTKLQGGFVWHSHEDTDDFFLVLEGQLIVRVRNQEGIVLNPGELLVIPKGVEHQPFAPTETHVMLIERTGIPNTGDAATAAVRTVI